MIVVKNKRSKSSGAAKRVEERGFLRSVAETYKPYPLQVLLKHNRKIRFAANYSRLVYCGSLNESEMESWELCISFKFGVFC